MKLTFHDLKNKKTKKKPKELANTWAGYHQEILGKQTNNEVVILEENSDNTLPC